MTEIALPIIGFIPNVLRILWPTAATATLLSCVALLLGGTVMSDSVTPAPPLYHPPAMWAWDFWFAKEGDTYHAFYLQAPWALGEPRLMHGNQHVGHASSQDLIHWTDLGPALVPIPDTWNDRSIATGSVAKHDGKWWMLFTGIGTKQCGLGLAVSDDLMTWKKVGDGPVIPMGKPFDATWQGQPIQWFAIADPYLYPEAVDGWYYVVINSQVVGAPIAESGCLATMRSRDMKTWEPAAVISYPGWVERQETPQIWHHGNRWYMYFGAAHDHGLSDKYKAEMPPEVVKSGIRVNCIFTSEHFEGPFEPIGKWWLTFPDGRFGYIAKIIAGPDGKEVLLMADGAKLSRPYPVSYAADGSVVLGVPAVPAP